MGDHVDEFQGAYLYDGENCAQTTLSFTASTGIFKGKFNLYYDYVLNGRLRHLKTSIPYSGILSPVRGAAFDDAPHGLGFSLVPDNDPAYKQLKRSFPIELTEAPE
jgi:hypothetical protein